MYESLQNKKLIHTNYKNIIQASLRSPFVIFLADCDLSYVPFVSFWLKKKCFESWEKIEY